MISEPSRPQASRSLSTPGLVVMGLGLGMAAFELRYGLVLMRLGNIGRIVVLTCAAGFSVWGLKELIAGWWPSLGGRGFTRHRSGFPVEGRIYLGILIVMFAGALLGRSNPLLLVFSAMAGPYVVNGWISFVLLKKLSVERKPPVRVMAGEPTSVEVILKNGKRWLSAWVMIMRDAVSGPAEHLSAEVLVPRVPPRGERRVRYRMTLAKRGLYEIGPMSISTRFPLGLAERTLTVESSSSILVYPRIGRLTAQWQLRMQSATDLVPHSSPRSGPFDDEFHKLREYRPGDDPRAIHWKTSARRDELMIREFRESRDRALTVLIDPWAPARPTLDDDERVESAIRFAATICVHHLHNSRESHLTVHAAGDPAIDWSSSRGRLETLLDQFALFAPSPNADLLHLPETANGRRSARSRVLLVSTRPREARQWLGERSGNGAADSRKHSDSIQVLDADPEKISTLVDWRTG